MTRTLAERIYAAIHDDDLPQIVTAVCYSDDRTTATERARGIGALDTLVSLLSEAREALAECRAALAPVPSPLPDLDALIAALPEGYTEGPWTCNDMGDVRDAAGYTVLAGPGYPTRNARLIALAPEMAAMLVRCREALSAAEERGRSEERGAGVASIAAERQRQREVEGWTPEHDRRHGDFQLLDAAVCYLLAPHYRASIWPPDRWPWEPEAWKPSPNDRRRELVKAGALIAAEIDRMDAIERAAHAPEPVALRGQPLTYTDPTDPVWPDAPAPGEGEVDRG